MTSVILSGIGTLKEIGFFDFFLPFLLFFAIIYGALERTKVFGEGRKDINAIIALVISLIASTTGWVLKGITGFLPWVGFTALIIVSFLMLAAMVAGPTLEEFIKNKYVVTGGVIFIVLVLFFGAYYSLGLNEKFGSFGLSDADIALLLLLLIGIGAFAVIVKGGKKGG